MPSTDHAMIRNGLRNAESGGGWCRLSGPAVRLLVELDGA
jgi:hypothetical protein